MNASTPPTNSNPKPDPESTPCTAPRPDSEADPDLAHLRRTYGYHWCIWRTPNWWMATARINGVTPTVMERTPDDLARQLRNPGRQIGGPIAT